MFSRIKIDLSLFQIHLLILIIINKTEKKNQNKSDQTKQNKTKKKNGKLLSIFIKFILFNNI